MSRSCAGWLRVSPRLPHYPYLIAANYGGHYPDPKLEFFNRSGDGNPHAHSILHRPHGFFPLVEIPGCLTYQPVEQGRTRPIHFLLFPPAALW